MYKNILQENIDAAAQYIIRLISHNGNVDIAKLRIVEINNGIPTIRVGQVAEKRSNFVLETGGEVVNSFCTLYEVGYVFLCVFLAGVGTALLRKNLLEKAQHRKGRDLLQLIEHEFSVLMEDEIFNGMKRPDIGIVMSLDTDVIPLRYNKHQLWRLDSSVLTKHVVEITSHDYGVASPPPLNPDYWISKDREIAEFAMRHAASLPEAKIIQYYLVLQIFLQELGIDINQLPLYFNLVPKEELIAFGAESSYLQVLIGLHTPDNRRKYRKITGSFHPWFISRACPRCGLGDKRVLSSMLMEDGKTVKVRCRQNEYAFRNEHGDTVAVQGCGYSFSFQVPDTPSALYDFFCSEDFTLHFATRQLTTILKDTVYNPIAAVVTDLGLTRDAQGQLRRNQQHVKGYGDHLDMITSALTVQHFFIQGKIAGNVAQQLKKQHLVMPLPMLLLGYDRPTELVDSEVTTSDTTGKQVPVTDTSALKALQNGVAAKDLLKKAVHIHAFSLEELLELRGKSLDSLGRALL